jgi:hypothetical protein
MEYPYMKRLVTSCAVLGAGLMWTSFALAAQPQLAAPSAPQAEANRGTMAAYFEDEKKKDDVVIPDTAPAADCGSAAAEPSCGTEPSCATEPSCGTEASCGCEPSCGCNGCGSGCGCDCALCIDNMWPFCCCCDYGDPCTLKSHLSPCCDLNYGGWIAMGYYSDNDPLSTTDNDLLSFWDNPNDLNLDQAWFYVEDLAVGECAWDCGYRFDLLYGVDAQKMQAFGNSGFPNPQGYDNGWDHGKYGWALPQAYLQFNKGDLDIKVGHFFTPLGYEVLNTTGNFFYSHNFTMFNSEPFTHTGALGTYKASDTLTYYAGWTLGWDTGYDQFGNGSNFIGGFTSTLSENAKYTYLCTAGDLGWRGDGYSHSNVLDVTLSKKWQYVFQSDLLDTTANSSAGEALSYGAVNYLFYTINDCWKWGTRAEWWKSNTAVAGDTMSFYEVTTGLNYKASANLLIRPEVKFNFCPAKDTFEANNGEFNETLFGVDAIYTF